MEPSEYLSALRKRWLIIVIAGMLGAAAGIALATTTTPTYRATSKVFVSLARGETVSELVQGSTFTQNLVQSYAQLATMPVVLDPVIEKLGLDTTSHALARSVSADTPLNTVIIEISAVSASPESAAEVANTVADQLAVTVQDVSPKGADNSQSVELRTVADAQVPAFPFAPNTRFTAATGLILGLGVGVAFALARSMLDTKVRTAKDVNRVTDAGILGTIGFERRPRDGQFVMRSDTRSPRAESYRRLRTNLQFLDAAGKLRSLVVTSALPGEGKTTTAINLALAMAEGSARVVLIDADLRRPSVAYHCGLEGSVGLTTVLIGQATLDDVVQPWGSENLHVLPAGKVPPNPSQLLGSGAMAELLDQLLERYDTVIFDSAPLLPVADSTILSRVADGALIVAGCRKVHRHQLADALGTLDSVGAVCLGVVVNRIAKRETDGYYGYEPRSPRAHKRALRDRPPTIAQGLLGRRGPTTDRPATAAHPPRDLESTTAEGPVTADHGTLAAELELVAAPETPGPVVAAEVIALDSAPAPRGIPRPALAPVDSERAERAEDEPDAPDTEDVDRVHQHGAPAARR